MDSICVISYTGINDSRALRTIKLMASIENIEIDFFFLDETIDYTKFRLLTLTSTDLQLEFSDGENTFIYIMKRK